MFKKSSVAIGLGVMISASVIAGPYTPDTPVTGGPVPSTDTPYEPRVTPGKEYSHELDRSSTHAGVVLDDQQVTMWDGKGGIDDTFDYDGANVASGNPNKQVDAIANHADLFFHEVRNNQVPLLYSERVTVPGTAVYAQGTGSDTAAPVYYETIGGTRASWATWAQVDQNGGQNLDGLEVWGPNFSDDSNKYSLFGDLVNSCSVFNLDSSCYVSHAELAGVVVPFLFSEFGWNLTPDQVDVDGLMVFDTVDLSTTWDDGDWLMFSLWPMDGSPLTGDGVYLWNRGAANPVSWLNHGGHLWREGWLGTNVDALEAAVPEPTALVLLGIGLAGLGAARRRRIQGS